MKSPMPTWKASACARKRLGRALLVPGMGLAVLLAVNPATALAQSGAMGGSGKPGVQSPPSTSAAGTPAAVGRPHRLADFLKETASVDVKHVAHWVVDSGDNGGMPYMIVDKVNARVFMFDAAGRLEGTESALLGMVRGDGTAKGIGDQKLSDIRPEDRTTPAGRFVASLDRDLQGQTILWIDYASALALHRVVKGKPTERRAERLQSATSEDNRISFGCINVPVEFFEKVVSPLFSKSSGIVYILPETTAARNMFGSYDVKVEQ